MKFRIWFGLVLMVAGLVLSTTGWAHGIPEAQRQLAIDGSNLDYIWLGASHMMTGYDHLLFIFGVVFFLTGFKDILKYITAFTLGHSITLTFATFAGITANAFLIDAVIALTVCYKGFENLDGFKKTLGMKSPNLMFMVFGFGLVHGFGLSTRLQELPLPQDGLLARILSFNLGVELGQIAALMVMVLILTAWRHTASFKQFTKLANAALIVAGALLFLHQMHGFLHDRAPDHFGFNEDAHFHMHEKWDEEKSVKKGGKKKKSQTHSHDGTTHTH